MCRGRSYAHAHSGDPDTTWGLGAPSPHGRNPTSTFDLTAVARRCPEAAATAPSVGAGLLHGARRSSEGEDETRGLTSVARSVPGRPGCPGQWENRADPRSHGCVSAGAAHSLGSGAPALWWEVLLRRSRAGVGGLPRRTGLRGRASDLLRGRPGAIPVTGGDSVPGSSPATGHVPVVGGCRCPQHPPSTEREAYGPQDLDGVGRRPRES